MEIFTVLAPSREQKQQMRALEEACHAFDGSFSQTYLETTYNVDPNMPAFILAMEGQTLLGFAYLYADEPGEADVTLYVAPSHRRNGIMKKLLVSLEKLAQNYGLVDLEFVTERVFLEQHPNFCQHLGLEVLEGSEIWLTLPAGQRYEQEKRAELDLLLADEEQLAAIVDFQQRAFNHDEETARHYAQTSLANPQAQLYVFQKEGRVCGSCTVDISGSVCHFFGLAMDPADQGQGLGTYFMQALINHLTEQLAWGFQLVVEDENLKARKFYEKLGFKERTEVLYLKEKR